MKSPGYRVRHGLSLVEILVSAALLGAGAWSVLTLIQSTYRETLTELRREAARTAAGNVLDVLSSVRFAEIEKEFGPGGPRALDPLASPLLKRVPRAPIVSTMETRVKLMRSPSDPGSGHLEVRMVYREDDDRPRTLVLGRTLTDPARAGRLGDVVRGEQKPENLLERASLGLGTRRERNAGTRDPWGDAPYSPAQHEALQTLLTAMPDDAMVRVVMRIAKLDGRDGRFDLDWPRLVAMGLRSGWDPVIREIAERRVPDGDYAAQWDVIPLRDPPGAKVKRRPGTVTVYRLSELSGTVHFLVKMAPGETAPVTLCGDPARVEQVTAVPTLVAPGVTRRETQDLEAILTAERVHLVHQPVDALGRAGRYEPRMLVWTPPGAASGVLEAAERWLAKAATLVGLELRETTF